MNRKYQVTGINYQDDGVAGRSWYLLLATWYLAEGGLT